MLALIDETISPGSFENKLEAQLRRNGLPSVKYQLEGAAQHMATLIAGAYTASHTATQTAAQCSTNSSTSSSTISITHVQKHQQHQESKIY